MATKEFGFKKIQVWSKSMDFADYVLEMVENLNSKNKHYRLVEQIEAACISVPANIAEGKGRNSKKEFIRFLYIARASMYETITFLNICAKRNWISQAQLERAESEGFEIASMIKGLINAINRSLKSEDGR